MALFNRDYDRNFGYRGSGRTGYGSDFGARGGYDRGMNTTFNRGTMDGGGYDRGGAGYSSTPGYGQDYRTRNAGGSYDQPYWGYDTWRYDRNYKSREQTDAGDPFNDRPSGTPIRVMDEERDRGGWFGGGGYDRNFGYDRNYGNNRNFGGSNRGYGGGDYYGANPMGYDPYDGRGGDNHRLGRTYDAGFRGNRGNRGYDRDWF